MKKHSSNNILVEPRYRGQLDAAQGRGAGSGRPRPGFSLLEVIIATAVLAGSAMVLISLIGTGTRFGVKAEKLALAVTSAQSVLDEYLIDDSVQDGSAEVTGVVDGMMQFGYRLSVSNFEGAGDARNTVRQAALVRVTVEIFDSQQTLDSGSGRPICQLTRLIRPMSRPSEPIADRPELSSVRGPSHD